MKKIVVAAGCSAGSEKAPEAAVQSARGDGGRGTPVAVLGRAGSPRLGRLANGARSAARQRLEAILGAVGNFARSRGARLTPLPREGHRAEAIVSTAEENAAGPVVPGAGAATDGSPAPAPARS